MKKRSEAALDLYQLAPAEQAASRKTVRQVKHRRHPLRRRLLQAAGWVLWCEPFWLALLGPSILLREYLWDPWVVPWIVAALFLFWPLRLLTERRLAPATPLTWPLTLLLLWSPVGVWISAFAERSWDALGLLAFGLALCFALLNWPPARRRPWLLVLPVTVVGLVLAALGPALLQSMPDEFVNLGEEINRSRPANFFATGETVNPNILAGTLLLCVPLLLALAIRGDWSGRQWWWPLLVGLLIVPMLFTLFVAQSRGVYLAVVIAVVVVLALRWPWTGAIVGVALVAAFSVLSWDGVWLALEAVGSDGALTSLAGRQEVWLHAWQGFRDFPLTGIGIGTFDLVIPHRYPYVEIGSGAQIPHAHNLWLQVGVDLGLPGLLIYGWLWVKASAILVTILHRQGYGDEEEEQVPNDMRNPAARQRRRHLWRAAALRWALAAGALGSLAGMFVHGLVDATTWGVKLAFVPWLIFALVGLLDLQGRARTTNLE